MSHYHYARPQEQGGSWTERTAPDRPDYAPAMDDIESHARRQGFHNAHTSLGVAGHLVHMGAMLFPVLAAELITDATKYKKAVRIGAVATTVLYEGLYTMREAKRRERQEEKLAHCRSHD
ncbi:MAG TPA: hypothetical protein VFB14_24175 [Bryobacteraceae bacterium]|jgi:hypothetical protein|nr:hypothetical protein [Bryobacteraceae bacterium]